MSPTQWGTIRRAKGTDDQFLIGDLASAAPCTLWGLPVAVTTSIPNNKIVVANFTEAATVYLRAGLTVRSNSNGTGFRNNVTGFVAEERIALAVRAPSAICVATVA